MRRAPGIGVSATAVVAASLLGWLVDLVIGTLFLTGVSVSAGTGAGPSVVQLLVLILVIVAVRIAVAAWIVQAVVALFDAHVSLLRAAVALLVGNAAAMCIQLFSNHPRAGSLVLVWCIGCGVAALILSSGARAQLVASPPRPR